MAILKIAIIYMPFTS